VKGIELRLIDASPSYPPTSGLLSLATLSNSKSKAAQQHVKNFLSRFLLKKTLIETHPERYRGTVSSSWVSLQGTTSSTPSSGLSTQKLQCSRCWDSVSELHRSAHLAQKTLFRKEVLQAQRNASLGTIMVAAPLSRAAAIGGAATGGLAGLVGGPLGGLGGMMAGGALGMFGAAAGCAVSMRYKEA
jgi:hypothetical protein